MAQIPINRLVQPLKREEVLEDVIALGNLLKLKASSWSGPARFVLIALAEIGSRITNHTAKIASSGYLDTAVGNALTRRSKSNYDEDRIVAVRAKGRLHISDTGGVGPITIPAGTRAFAPASYPDLRWVNESEINITLDATDVEVTVLAEIAGSRHNDVPSYDEWEINPSIAGLTVSNPDIGITGTWLTVEGVDEESDPSLRQRDRDKWATLGGNPPSAAYDFWAKSATDSNGDPVGITRAHTTADPPGDGTINVYVAGPTATASGPQVSDVQDYIDARKSPTAGPTVVAATEVETSIDLDVIMLTGTPITEAQIEAEIDAFINALDIGGSDLGSGGVIPLGDLVQRIRDMHSGIRKVTVNTPASDPTLDENEVATNGSHTVGVTTL